MEDKYYYYALCFIDLQRHKTRTAYVRRTHNYITKKDVEAAQAHLNMVETSLISVSFLGYMTIKEFNGEE